MKREHKRTPLVAATPTAVVNGKELSMNNLPETQRIAKWAFSDQLVGDLQFVIGLIESDWRRIRSTMDPITEILYRQIHEMLAKLYEAHVSPGLGRRA